ncbi:hypothetical protein DWW78_06010 [Alistipes indistinctus]|nr:hypothetical protein [Alistipes indistinctus]RGU37248.1 hypothetical protein DWW78_06010 [Alistipes indistinctus]
MRRPLARTKAAAVEFDIKVSNPGRLCKLFLVIGLSAGLMLCVFSGTGFRCLIRFGLLLSSRERMPKAAYA